MAAVPDALWLWNGNPAPDLLRRQLAAAVERELRPPLGVAQRAEAAVGDQHVALQMIMAKTRHKSPRTAMRYVNPSAAAIAQVTELLDPPRRTQ